MKCGRTQINLPTTIVLAVVLSACRTTGTLTPAQANLGDVPVAESVVLARAGQESVEFPPFGRVVARPELYHEKRISLIGFMNLEFGIHGT